MARKAMTDRLNIRLRPKENEIIRRAADEHQDGNVTRYVVEAALEKAKGQGIE